MTLRYITLHYVTLHYVTLHYITLHYIKYVYIYINDIYDIRCPMPQMPIFPGSRRETHPVQPVSWAHH